MEKKYLKDRINILNITRFITAILFVMLITMSSWCSDDAYHSFIMAKHFAEGKGLVYNVGYRVTASTCPLFTIIEGILYFFFGHMYTVAIVMGIAFSTIAFLIITCKICKTVSTVILAGVLLLSSYCFVTFTTAGLENSLLYLLFTLFIYIYIKNETFNGNNLFVLMLISGLIAMTRMDSLLLAVPAIIYAFFFKTKMSFWRKVLISLGGVAPFILWELFSFIYYGFLFPNTYYVKVCTGFPLKEYIEKGLDFCFRSYSCDIALLFVPLLLIVCTLLIKNNAYIMIMLGVVLYTLYIVSVGGDFMLGRHLTVQYLISTVLLLDISERYIDDTKLFGFNMNYKSSLWIVCLFCVIFTSCTNNFFKMHLAFADGNNVGEETSVADEKAWYTKAAGYTIDVILCELKGIDIRKQFVGDDWFENVEKTKASGNKGIYVYTMCSGMMAYYASEIDDLYMTDKYGLMDPLLAHLPAEHPDYWRVGHMYRPLPAGYDESVQKGENLIVNSSLHEYYDKMLYVITGDVFDINRIETSLKMNMGEYNYLIEEYVESMS